MFDIVLYQPEIPPNTGNIIRLSANTGCRLHLVKPLGFSLEDKLLQRAGLDYHEYATVKTHENWEECLGKFRGGRMFALTTKGSARYSEVAFQRDDVFVFGPETRGLPVDVLAQFDESRRIRLPMRAESRSLNLSNSVAVVVFEAWRQIGFEGGK
ncbi:RNA methyltransferase [Sulfuricella sp. T08]|uniref:tRNA (uridine(34)/cytosine(34)/5- carboxymethylaminomethyluridine(34)-2'-O)- methyltransferase TrmL n=1 Tax=Sulfuricella sp. T08 TaxID=1632857 RepID=UPI000617A1C0|nr:tRNA (uridine(34)/cytosine(34)/5-carboxymethylaminomethyluridine(34)-2'-O)-methyltransferase TrmL [Sulfuricella sp. T08]GAO36562.1 RNA methyltransferase [Sulfuricella sp. T08]